MLESSCDIRSRPQWICIGTDFDDNDSYDGKKVLLVASVLENVLICHQKKVFDAKSQFAIQRPREHDHFLPVKPCPKAAKFGLE